MRIARNRELMKIASADQTRPVGHVRGDGMGEHFELPSCLNAHRKAGKPAQSLRNLQRSAKKFAENKKLAKFKFANFEFSKATKMHRLFPRLSVDQLRCVVNCKCWQNRKQITSYLHQIVRRPVIHRSGRRIRIDFSTIRLNKFTTSRVSLSVPVCS